MEGDSLRSAIDIYALQITVAFDDSLGIEVSFSTNIGLPLAS